MSKNYGPLSDLIDLAEEENWFTTILQKVLIKDGTSDLALIMYTQVHLVKSLTIVKKYQKPE